MTSENPKAAPPSSAPPVRPVRRFRGRAAACLAVLVTAAAVGAVYGVTKDRETRPPSVSDAGPGGEASERFPAATLADWVTYADQVAVVSVVDEAEIPPGLDFAADGDYVLRNVKLRIDSTLWRREGGARAPDTVTVRTWGWFERNGQRTRAFAADAPRLEEGERYLTPLVSTPDGWTPLADASILTLSGDAITSRVETGEPRDVARSLQGKSIREADGAVTNSRPIPQAAAYMDLDPDTRARKTLEALYPDSPE